MHRFDGSVDLRIGAGEPQATDGAVRAETDDADRRCFLRFVRSVVLITHDLAVVAEVADDILVMYAGRAVERAWPRRCSPTRRTPTPGACSSLRPRLRGAGPPAAIRGPPPSLVALPAGLLVPPPLRLQRGRRRRCATDAARARRPRPGDEPVIRCHLPDPRGD